MIIGSFMPSENPFANNYVVNKYPRPTKIQPPTPIAFTTFSSNGFIGAPYAGHILTRG
jgi:hypothetical protein